VLKSLIVKGKKHGLVLFDYFKSFSAINWSHN